MSSRATWTLFRPRGRGASFGVGESHDRMEPWCVGSIYAARRRLASAILRSTMRPRGRSSVGRASASQAEGRGFETRRPLSSGCRDLHGFAGSRRRIWLVEATNGLGGRRSSGLRRGLGLGLRTVQAEMLATSWATSCASRCGQLNAVALRPRRADSNPDTRIIGAVRAGRAQTRRDGAIAYRARRRLSDPAGHDWGGKRFVPGSGRAVVPAGLVRQRHRSQRTWSRCCEGRSPVAPGCWVE